MNVFVTDPKKKKTKRTSLANHKFMGKGSNDDDEIIIIIIVILLLLLLVHVIKYTIHVN